MPPNGIVVALDNEAVNAAHGQPPRGVRPPPPGWPEPLGEDAYYGIVGQFVRLVSLRTEADPAAITLEFLVPAGNFIGRTAYAAVGETRHYTNENVVIVAESSKGRKGDGRNIALRVFREVDPEWERSCTTSGIASGEAIVHAVRDARYELDEQGEQVLDDEGKPKLIDAGVADKRVYIAEPEYGRLLRTAGRPGNVIPAVLREAWESGALRVTTKHSPDRATNAHISLSGHITSEELHSELPRVELYSGSANRVLFCCARRQRFLPRSKPLPAEALAPIVNSLRDAKRWAEDRGQLAIDFDDEAGTLWDEIYSAMPDHLGAFGAVIARAEPHILRLALIYAVLDTSRKICVPHLKAALEIWRYCEGSARYIFGDMTGNKDADSILFALRKDPEKGLARTEISTDVFGGHRSKTEIDQALGRLEKNGLARCEKQPTGGRTTERWFGTANTA